MSQSELTLWVAVLTASAGFLGALVGAAAAVVAPLLVTRAEGRRLRREHRNRLLREFIDHTWELAQHPAPFPTADAARLGKYVKQQGAAQRELQLLLTSKDEERARDYMAGLQRRIASYGTDVARRQVAAEQGGSELLDWAAGRAHDFTPFDAVGYGPAGELLWRPLQNW